MTVDLREKLEQLGLTQYHDVFVAEGFDTWETVLDITESDLNSLNVKLGHRRKLQRAISDTRNQADFSALHLHHHAPSIEGSLRSDDSGTEGRPLKRVERTTAAVGPSTKRRYRRHPKPDENAPDRPASAYVIFSNQVREELKGQELSFTEIAKIVGERWQVLAPEIKDGFERQAAAAKEKYYAELAEYKKTPQYTQYQEYLADFKAKHAPASEGKRSKLETETSISTQSSGNDNERISRKPSTSFQEGSTARVKRSPSSPPAPYMPTSGQSRHSKNVSLTSLYPSASPPKPREQYSPMSTSPVSGPVSKEGSHEPYGFGRTSVREPYERHSDPTSAASSATFPPSHSSLVPASPQRPPPVPIPHRPEESRRTRRDSTSLPPLVHESTTISSEGSYHHPSWYGPQSQSALGLSADTLKQHPHRILPQPVPMPGAAPSPLDQRQLTGAPPSGTQSDPRYASSLAALLRAGELARDADIQPKQENDEPEL